MIIIWMWQKAMHDKKYMEAKKKRLRSIISPGIII